MEFSVESAYANLVGVVLVMCHKGGHWIKDCTFGQWPKEYPGAVSLLDL